MDQLFIPAWIEAISTFLAFVAASIAALFAWLHFKNEKVLAEKENADSLSAWW